MSDSEEEFYQAVTNADIEQIKEYLKKGACANHLVASGQTILGHAVQLGHIEVIETLLDAEKYMPPRDFSCSASPFEDPSLELDSYLKPSWFQWEQHSEALDCTEPQNSDFPMTSMPEGATNSAQDETEGLPLPLRPSSWELHVFRSLRKFSSQRRNCDVNLADFYDRMPIHYAAELGNPQVLELLLKAGCRVNVSDSKNVTPLHFAVGKGHEGVTEVLLKAGSRVNSKTSDKSSALHLAASRGYARIVEKLLSFGAKIDILDASDRTPLFLAVSRLHHQVTKILLQKGAKVNVEEIHGYTPLSEAVFQKDAEMVHLLLSAGAKVTASHHLLHFSVYHRQLNLAKQLLGTGGLQVNRHDDCGDTPLHIAVRCAQVEIVELLLDNGAEINARNVLSGQSLLHEAVDGIQESDYDSFHSILQMLLQRRCKLNIESFTPGDTPLYRAILLDKYRFAEELIKHGSDVNLGNVYSCNIDNLCLARRKNHFRSVRLLVYAGFHLWRTPWLEILPPQVAAGHSYPLPITGIKGWLIHMKSNPMNLIDSCRIAIRCNLGQNLVFKVRSLTIPERMKRFLLLEDVSSVKDEERASGTSAVDASNANVVWM